MDSLLFDFSPEAAHLFLKAALAELAEHKITTKIENSLQIEGCSGYFNTDPLEFVVAIGKPFKDWFLVFVHEFSHFKQYLSDPVAFGVAAAEIGKLFEWLAGEIELTPTEINDFGELALLLEYDAENQVLEHLGELGIASLIDANEYAQKANSYFNFYNYVIKHRKWYVGGKEPYTIPEVWQSFSTALHIDVELTPEREELFSRCVKL